MAESIPPLRVREEDGSPNVIPVFEIAVSGGAITNRGAGRILLTLDSGGAGTSVTYAATGNQYVVMALAGDLTDERRLQAGTGLRLTDVGAGADVLLSLETPVVVSSGGTGTTTFTAMGVLYGSGGSPVQALAAMVSGSLIVGSGTTTRPFILPGGGQGQYLISTGGVVGNLAWVNTLGGAAAVTYAPTGGNYLTFAPDGALSADQALIAGTGIAVASDGTNFFVSLVTPVVVPSGGTGAATFTPFGLLYGSGATQIRSVVALSMGQFVVGSAGNVPPLVFNTGAAGTMLISSGANGVGLAWVTSPAADTGIVYAATANQYLTVALAADLTAERRLQAGTGLYSTDLGANNDFLLSNSAKAIRVPLALMTVQPDSANTFWRAVTLPLLDAAYVGFLDGAEGIATYWGLVPLNLHPDPNWSLVAYHMPEAGAGGNAFVTVRGGAVSQAESASYSLLSSAVTLVTQVSTMMAISTASVGDLDGTLALSGGDLLLIELTRHGGHGSDTVGAQWNLYSLALECNVL